MQVVCRLVIAGEIALVGDEVSSGACNNDAGYEFDGWFDAVIWQGIDEFSKKDKKE